MTKYEDIQNPMIEILKNSRYQIMYVPKVMLETKVKTASS